ncbi:putative transcriptional regulatory protein pdtaR [Gluconacetobacter sp. SXCC-1]|uniref:ANTAR domain-containing response regulator n=1 Tax=Komagataeibacter rhaeticus TaxID=215221 RepID=UPI000207FAE3|nr:ANTAR domain-containing protein [Komagataeibacter rhaeticus]ATU71766.1 response regulator [Komagataeibacter xylinus]EGG75714.1 putative transcriptional regulatory protein pdtaR [Gluconacetobacter sp. SXCC-1]WPP23212.1 ANTAR domain-containing protein [Komagataeibacter rhaeticus]
MRDRFAPGTRLRVLVADENPRRGRALSEALHADASLDVLTVPPGTALIDAVRDYGPDVVLVDMNRADRDALDSIRALSRSALERPVALFVDEDDVELMETAFDTGICSYNVLEALPRDVKPLLRAAIALYARFRRTRDELSEAQRVLAERGIIEQAKRCFMKNEKTSEAQAYRWLQRRAMQTSRRIVAVAEAYLAAQKKDEAS